MTAIAEGRLAWARPRILAAAPVASPDALRDISPKVEEVKAAFSAAPDLARRTP